MRGWLVAVVIGVAVVVTSRVLAGLATTERTVNGGDCQ